MEKMDKKDAAERKISIRQVMIMFFFSAVSGIMRVTTPESGIFFSKVGWLSPVFAVLPVFILIFILNKITENHRDKSLAQITEIIFGKIIGKIFLFLFLIHVLFFISFYLKNFGDKFVLSVFPDVSAMFFIIILLLFAIIAVCKNIESFARFSEFSFIIISVVFILSFFLILFYINPKNLYPVTYYDTADILKSSVPMISLWSLLTFSLFLGDNIRYSGKLETDDADIIKNKFKRTAIKFMFIIALVNLLSLIAVIGIFNAETAKNLSMPYFMIFKSIKTVGVIQSFETFFIILWAFTDFIMITYYMFIMSKISKTLFAVSEKSAKLFMYPAAFAILLLVYLANKFNFNTEYFYTNILSYSSVILGYIFPFLLLALGKIRRVL